MKFLITFCPFLFMILHVHGKGMGGTFFALGGKDCVVIATDARYSGPRGGGTYLTQEPRRIYKVGDSTLIGCHGLESDAEVLINNAQKIFQQFELDCKSTYPNHISKLISLMLYSGQFVVTPLIAGLRPNGKPYICSMDGIGAQTETDSFAAVGTSSSGLLAICESLYQPNLSGPELVQLAERCLRLAFQRDALSGGGKIKLVTLIRKPEYFVRNIGAYPLLAQSASSESAEGYYEEGNATEKEKVMEKNAQREYYVQVYSKVVDVPDN